MVFQDSGIWLDEGSRHKLETTALCQTTFSLPLSKPTHFSDASQCAWLSCCCDFCSCTAHTSRGWCRWTMVGRASTGYPYYASGLGSLCLHRCQQQTGWHYIRCSWWAPSRNPGQKWRLLPWFPTWTSPLVAVNLRPISHWSIDYMVPR